jgi:hypothetical protein
MEECHLIHVLVSTMGGLRYIDTLYIWHGSASRSIDRIDFFNYISLMSTI